TVAPSSQVNVRFHDDFTPGVLTPYGLAQPTVNAGEEILIGPSDGGAMTVVHADDTPRGYHHVIVDGLGLGTIAITNDTHIGKPYHDGIKIEGIGLREAEYARWFATRGNHDNYEPGPTSARGDMAEVPDHFGT